MQALFQTLVQWQLFLTHISSLSMQNLVTKSSKITFIA